MINQQDLLRVAAQSMCAPATIKRCYEDPSSVRESSWKRIVTAAVTLGIKPPKKQN